MAELNSVSSLITPTVIISPAVTATPSSSATSLPPTNSPLATSTTPLLVHHHSSTVVPKKHWCSKHRIHIVITAFVSLMTILTVVVNLIMKKAKEN